ncbi:MAG: glycosyltransferase family 4 protein [Candidatus Binataceae bacterium]|nr:glycosyltransferase family 4 protein [Candidatus Binataceae bacterium]
MRIAQIAPLFESVPPKLYGGTERVAAYLSEELARQGHEVTLFASGDSTAKVKLEPGYPESLRLAHLDHLGPMYHLPMLSAAYDHAERFDIIHSHVDYWSYPFARLVATPTISTMHGRLDLPEIAPVYRHYCEQPVVSISDSQRHPLPEVNWVGTVYHGLPRELLNFRSKPGDYLAFLGRMSPEKGPDRAIEVARRAGVPLRMAAKVDRLDREYFETVVKPMLREPGVEFIGEINEVQKQEFLGNAMALLFPIDWPEPFGLVMIEALACGTPVIARPCGSVTEILRDGVGGLLASNTDDLVDAVRRVAQMSRRACRDEFDQRFTSEVMAANYLRLYRRLIENAKASRRAKQSGESND